MKTMHQWGWLLVVLLAGCSGSAPLRHHLIDPGAETALEGSEAFSAQVQIIDVRIPRYLDGSAIIARNPDGELVRSAEHRWGDPLAHNLPRTLARDLATLLGQPQVGHPRLPVGGTVDCRVLVNVDAFERAADAAVVLELSWQLWVGDARPLRYRSELRASPVASGVPAQVEAMETLFARFARNAAREILSECGASA